MTVLPGLSTCLPPYTSVAPSFTPTSQYSSSLSRWALWFCGPWSVERSSGSPIFIFLISSTLQGRDAEINKYRFTILMITSLTPQAPCVTVLTQLQSLFLFILFAILMVLHLHIINAHILFVFYCIATSYLLNIYLWFIISSIFVSLLLSNSANFPSVELKDSCIFTYLDGNRIRPPEIIDYFYIVNSSYCLLSLGKWLNAEKEM